MLIFVHGWSVTHTDTYGGLPEWLKRRVRAADVRHIYLGEFVSFRDEVRLGDIAQAFQAALAKELASVPAGTRFACVAHSTGGPVIREWLDRFYVAPGRLAECPMSHLIMLAPANFGSALALLGKSRVSRLSNWFKGLEPGQGVLDWLELGSRESLRLNLRWIERTGWSEDRPPWLFVLTGDRIDRKLYDHVNSYTGEAGSDGVVRTSAANLNAQYLRFEQPQPVRGSTLASARAAMRELTPAAHRRSLPTAFKLIPGASHSGADMGIMRSVEAKDDAHPTPTAILRCLAVNDAAAYRKLRQEFEQENAQHQREGNRLEIQRVPVLPDREYIHDPHATVLFRLYDDHHTPITDADLLITAGPRASPDELPERALVDRQANRLAPHCLSFHINFARLAGSGAIARADGSIARPALIARGNYGLRVEPRSREDLVMWFDAEYPAATQDLLPYLRPNETTIVDIVLTRVVREGVFRLRKSLRPRSFKDDPPGTV